MRIATDADLDRFVRPCSPARGRRAIRAGRLRFTLGGGAPSAGVVRIDRGAVTERDGQARRPTAGARLVLGPGAVLTPLAREKARALGIEIERER